MSHEQSPFAPNTTTPEQDAENAGRIARIEKDMEDMARLATGEAVYEEIPAKVVQLPPRETFPVLNPSENDMKQKINADTGKWVV